MALGALLKKAEEFVKGLLNGHLPANMHFHNLQHTLYVVNAAHEIGVQSNLGKQDMMIVQLAAWFHDTGYCYAYRGHEDNSIAIAATFLKQEHADDDLINAVIDCIAATKMPQNPQTLLQKIMCDADMFHLADDNYITYSARLKDEWEFKLNKKYKDVEWRETNLNLLVQHRYFTSYGKDILQKKKLNNIDKLLGI